MKIIITEQQLKTLLESEDRYYFEDPYIKDQELHYHNATQDEINRFINHREQFNTPEPKKIHINHEKHHKIKQKKNGYGYLYRLSQQVGYGPIKLMRWKKWNITNKDKIEGSKYKVISDTGDIKLHNTNKYFYF